MSSSSSQDATSSIPGIRYKIRVFLLLAVASSPFSWLVLCCVLNAVLSFAVAVLARLPHSSPASSTLMLAGETVCQHALCILTLIVLVVSAMMSPFLPAMGLDTQAGCRVSSAPFWAVVKVCRVNLRYLRVVSS